MKKTLSLKNCNIKHHSEGHKKNGMLSQTRRQNKIMKNNDPEITNHVLWPTELKRQMGERSTSHSSTRYPCFGQDLGDLRGASRAGLTRLQSYALF